MVSLLRRKKYPFYKHEKQRGYISGMTYFTLALVNVGKHAKQNIEKPYESGNMTT